MRRFVIIVSLLLFGNLTVWSQIVLVGDVEIIPPNPTIADSVKVRVQIHTNDHSNKINDSLSIIGDTISIYYCISSSPGMTAPTFIDTFELGMFTAGDYFVVVNAYKAIDTVDCSNPIDSARGTETFTITETISVHRETLESDFFIQLAPNPTNDFQTLTLKTATSGKIHIKIYDLSGRMVRQVFFGEMQVGEQSFLADLRDLRRGTYFYKVRTEESVNRFKAVKL